MANTNATRLKNIEELAQFFDHTLLKPTATIDQIKQLCHQAATYHFKGVCIPPCYVVDAKKYLTTSPKTLVLTVVGFPLGYQSTSTKITETQQALDEGAQEIDMVVNLASYFSGLEKNVRTDIASIVKTADSLPVKVIIETGFLNTLQIKELSQWAALEGAAYVKTSTGFGPRGASVEDIITIRQALQELNLPHEVKIKASGGIRNLEQALSMIEAGAARIGASSSVEILNEFAAQK